MSHALLILRWPGGRSAPAATQRGVEANRPSSEGQSLDVGQVVGLVPEGHHRCGTAPDSHRLPRLTPPGALGTGTDEPYLRLRGRGNAGGTAQAMLGRTGVKPTDAPADTAACPPARSADRLNPTRLSGVASATCPSRRRRQSSRSPGWSCPAARRRHRRPRLRSCRRRRLRSFPRRLRSSRSQSQSPPRRRTLRRWRRHRHRRRRQQSSSLPGARPAARRPSSVPRCHRRPGARLRRWSAAAGHLQPRRRRGCPRREARRRLIRSPKAVCSPVARLRSWASRSRWVPRTKARSG